MRSSAPATVFVDTPKALRQAASKWSKTQALAVDTEFVRERTFFPQLGLVQVFDGEEIYLIDPVGIDNLAAIERVLVDPDILKVFHSCSEDLEVLYHRLGRFPHPVFDTQIAASLGGRGVSIGYGNMVRDLIGVELEKGQTRTNWLRRPLTPAQIHYAAQDVAHLLTAHRLLGEELSSLGREAWLAEEIEKLFDASRFLPDPGDIYLRVPRARDLSRRELAALQALSRWREEEARRRDLPRNFVLHQAHLPVLARRRPRNLKQLSAVRELDPKTVRRYGRVWLEMLRAVDALSAEELPPRIERPRNLTPHRPLLQKLRQAVADRAHELGLAPELLASKKTVTAVLDRVLSRRQPTLPSELRGWRQEVVGDHLLEILSDELPGH